MFQDDYEKCIDEGSGKAYFIDRNTGEIIDSYIQVYPVGTRCYTPAQQEKYKERKEKENMRNCRKEISGELGQFFSVSTGENFPKLSAETMTRLIYLNTFIKHGTNQLMLTERKPMKRSNLSKVLGISKTSAFRFWKDVNPAYITENKDGELLTNKKSFFRGNAGKRRELHQKIYIEGVRKLYKSTTTNKHKHLGHLFLLLPYVNTEYNVLCFNPLEAELDKIDCMTVADFCRVIGYDITHFNRLLATYRKATFDVNGHEERFCSIVYDGKDMSLSKICINPHILYCGTDYKKVGVLGVFHK